MGLISVSNMQAVCDYMAAVYNQQSPVAGTKSGGAVVGTSRGGMNAMLNKIIGLSDYQQLLDLMTPANNALAAVALEPMLSPGITGFIQNLSGHCFQRGPSVAAAISDFVSYLVYYNNGTGGNKFSGMMVDGFGSLFLGLNPLQTGSKLPYPCVMSPTYQPDYNPTYANGMGTKTSAGSFTAGQIVDSTTYAEIVPVCEVIVAFSGGSSPPTVALAGTDDQGNACTYGAISLTGNNPAAGLSGVTVTPAITAGARQTVAFSSATGIVIGSVLTIQKNKPDQEVIVVENVSGSNITAVFLKAHAGSATVDGWNSYTFGNASTGSGRRLRSLSGITIAGGGGWAAGTVRISGPADRVAALA